MCTYCNDPDHYYGPYEKEADRVARLLEFLESEDEMDVVPNNTSKEPALKVGAATGTITGLIAVLSYFFPKAFESDHTQLLVVLAAFLLPIITAIITRDRVWSPASVQEEVDKAVQNAKDAMPKKNLPRQ